MPRMPEVSGGQSEQNPHVAAAQINVLDKDDDLIELAAAAAGLVQLAGSQSAHPVGGDRGPSTPANPNYVHYFESSAGASAETSDYLEGEVRVTPAASR